MSDTYATQTPSATSDAARIRGSYADSMSTQRPTTGPTTTGPTTGLPIVGAIVATLMRVAAAIVALAGSGDGSSEETADLAPMPSSAVPVPSTTVAADLDPAPGEDGDGATDVLEPVPVVPSLPDEGPEIAEPDVVIPPVAPPAPSGQQPPVPTSSPAAPQADLSVQATMSLDPGVLATSLRIENVGDAPLDYAVAAVGAGFDVDAPAGTVAAGAHLDLWVTIDATAVDGGPTPFERDIEITSNGGTATVTITGQVEKPGHVIADFESVPLAAYRSTVTFTNVGGLAMAIVAIASPPTLVNVTVERYAASGTLSKSAIT